MNSLNRAILIIATSFILYISAAAQVTGINSVFPLQNALHTPNDVIISVQFNSPIDLSTLNDSTFIVMGEQSGMHFGAIRISLDSMYAEFAPDKPFFTGELVTVTLTRGIRESSGTTFNGFIWNFLVAVTNRTNARFTEPIQIWFKSGVTSVQLSDIDNDGDIDIGLLDGNHNFLTMLNDGYGNFSQRDSIKMNADPTNGTWIGGTGDLDLDGEMDFATVNYNDRTTILLWNDGNGIIEDTTVISNFLMRGPLIDVNQDGYVDLMGAGDDGETFTVRVNAGKRQFAGTIMSDFMHNGSRHYIFDSDNDGDIDILMSRDNMRLILGINAGDGIFSEEIIDSAYGNCSSTNCIVALDFNDDQLADIALVSAQNILLIYKNLDSTFILTSSTELQGDSEGKILGKDLDGDGDVDLVTSNTRGFGAMPSKVEENIQIWLNDGEGNFTLDQTHMWVDFFRRVNIISLADIENDGDLDLFLFGGFGIWILRNETIISVEDENSDNIPKGFSLSQNFPNPFNNATVINYSIPEASIVTIQIYNLIGQLVATPLDGFKAPGSYKTTWDGQDNYGKELTSGLYFYVIRAGEFKETRKMLLIR